MYIHGRPQNNFQDHRRLLGTTFRVTGGYRKTGTISLKRVTERFFTISDLIEANRNFILEFLHKKKVKNCENHKFSLKKYCFDF
jgi:hypothetical protein